MLEIIITTNLFVIVIVGLIIAFIVIISMVYDRNEKINKQIEKYHELEIEATKKEGELQTFKSETDRKVQEMALLQLDKWKLAELEGYKRKADEAGLDTARLMLQRWIIENEVRIRKDAANRSVRNVLGKVTEHLIPFSDAMKMFNPKDIRFIGSPIDLIVFEGAEELKKNEVVIHFIEVKTGTSALSKRQQLIRDAVINKRIEWMRVDMKSFGDEVNQALAE